MKKLMIISLACALGCGMHAMAQTINDLEAPKHLTATTAPLKDAGFDPSGKSALANIISNVSLNSTLNNGADAKLQAAYQFSPTWSANITAQQQLGKTDSSATFYDFSKGISPGTTITLNIQKLFWQPKLTKAGRDALIALSK